jgi:hypothetical protein
VTFANRSRWPAGTHGSRMFERVPCPTCQRIVAAYVPGIRFGQELRLQGHGRIPTREGVKTVLCPASGKTISLNYQDVWTLEPMA